MPKTVKFVSVNEAGTFLDVCPQTVYNMINDGRLTSYRKGAGGKGDQHNITLKSVITNIK